MLCTLAWPTSGIARPLLGWLWADREQDRIRESEPLHTSEPSRHVQRRAAICRPCRQVANRKREMTDRLTGLNERVN